jgi:hypothetical protein
VVTSASSGSDHWLDHVIVSVITLKPAYQGSNEISSEFIHLTLFYAYVLGIFLSGSSK